MKFHSFWKLAAILNVSFLLMLLIPAEIQAQTWYNASWGYRKAITIDYTKVGAGSHTNFPVLISITDANLQANALSSGNDILFTSSDGSAKLDHEIERYTSSSGALTAWVQLPSLSSTANTVIYMYYGNASATSQQNITGTWDASFKGVYHLNTTALDATSNNFDGAVTGGALATGKIAGGGGLSRQNGADYITIGGMMGSPPSITMSAWAYLNSGDQHGSGILSLGDKAAISMTNTTTSAFFYDGNTWIGPNANTNILNGWHYITGTFTSGGSSQRLYIDGALAASTTSNISIRYTGLGSNTIIGNHGNGAAGFAFEGSIDEVRVASVARSAGWILTEFNNQNTPSSFYIVGAQSSLTKTFTGTGTFSTAARWTGGTLPVAGENLVIDGACTVDNNAGTDNIAYGTLTIGTATARTLNWAASGVNRLNVSQASAGSALSTLDMTNGGTLVLRTSFIPTNLTFTSGNGTVEFQSTTNMPSVPGFNNLTINGSGTTSSSGLTSLVVNGTLTIGASAILDLGTTTVLSGTLDAVSNNGTIKTSVPTTTSALPLPAGKTWGGLVDYANTGGQTVVGGNYNNLTVRPGNSFTTTASGNIAVNGTLTVTTAFGAFDLSTYILSGTLSGISNSGDIRTSVPTSTSAVPIPAGKTWNGTVYYNALTGAQTVVGGTYNFLILSNTSGTNIAAGDITATAQFRTTAGGTLDMGSAYRLINGGTVTNNGTVKTSVLTATSANPLPSKNWGGTVEYAALAGAQTVVVGTYNNLKLSNTSGTNTANGNLVVGGVFTLTGGTLSTGANNIYLNSTGTISRTGGFVIGNFRKYIATGATSKVYEIGNTGNYTPATITFASVTTAGDLTASVTATDQPNLSGSGIRTDRSVNRYFSFTNSGISFTTASLSMNWVAADVDASATPANFIVGKYISPNWALPTFASPLATSIQATGLTTLGDFAMGEICNPTSGFSYPATPYCTNGGTISPTMTGTAGTFSTTGGLAINFTTGAISLASSPAGTYTVTNTVAAAAGCSSSVSTTNITVTAMPAATISYASNPYCSSSGAATVTRTGTAGGTYSSTTGLIINSTTGDITLSSSTAGTYTVTYTIAAAAGCAVFTTTTSITITLQPVTNKTYTGTPYCSNAGTVFLTGTATGAAGTYSSTAGLSITASTGAVNVGASTAGSYIATYTVPASGGCALYTFTTPIAVTAAPSANISYTGNPFCVTAAPVSVTQTGTAGGTYSSAAGLSINATNGTITPASSTPGSYTVTYLVVANAGCAQYTKTATVTITATPVATFSYTASSYCRNAANPSPTFSGGGVAGVFSSTGSLIFISTSTGQVNLAASAAGTYTVTNTINASGGCATVTATSTITISPVPTASIAYNGSPYCSTVATAFVTLSGTTGGTFSSTAGLSLNTTSGDITPGTSTPGTYTVTYTIGAAGGCAQVTATASVTVTTMPSATISYAGNPFCSTASPVAVTRTGTSVGTYTSAAGLAINASTGTITPASSTPNNYTVTYTISAAGGCALFSTTASVTVTATPSATISYATSSFCTSAGTVSVTRTGNANGVYSSTAGLSINTSTGEINPATSTPGPYTITYTIAAAGGCALFSATASVTVTATLTATINYSGTPYCSTGGVVSPTLTGTTGGSYSSTSGLSVNTASGAVDLGASTPGNYTVTYNLAASGGCAAFSTTTTITVTLQPFANGSYQGNPFCSNTGIVSPTGSFLGAFGTLSSTAGLSINSSNGAVDLGASTPGSYTVTYTVPASGGCAIYTSTTPLTITQIASATISYTGNPYCIYAGTATVTRTGTAGGTYSSTTGLTIDLTTGTITLSSSTAGDYTVTYTIPASGGCAVYTVTTLVSVVLAPSATISYTGSPYCFNAGFVSPTQTGTTGGTYSSASGLSINSTSGVVNTSRSAPGTYTVTYSIGATGGCSGFSTTAAITLTPAPSIWQFPFNNLITYYRFEGDALDVGGNNNGTLQNSPAPTADRFNIAGEAYLFNGSTQYVSTTNAYANPNNFTISIWFKTTTTTGGKLIGFGNQQTGVSGQYDRHIYMSNDGKIYFGVYPNNVQTVSSSLSYNDGTWHLATASLSSTAGMVLYMDGLQVGTNTGATNAENYTGYWRIGYDNVNSWTNQPNSFFFNGSLDEAFIYQRILTPAEVSVLYKSADGAGNNGPVCAGSTVSLSATSVSGATYAWTGPNGFSSALQNPSFTYAIASAGTYQVLVTLGTCTASAYTNVAPSSVGGQWTGSTSSDWANALNWCSGVLPDSSTNVIIATGAVNMPSIISSVHCNSLTINSGATVSVTSAGTLNIAGTLTNNGAYTDNGITNFNGTTGRQTFLRVTTFNNLVINNSNGLLVSAGITVKKDLTINKGILDVSNNGLSVAGSWYNNSSATAFTAGTSTIIFNSTTAKVIGGTFSTEFNNISLANTVSTITLQANISVISNLVVTSGTFDIGSYTANGSSAASALTVSTNATLKIGGTNTFPANYATINLVLSSNVEYAGTNQTVANQLYGNLKLSSSTGAAVKILPATPLTVVGNFSSAIGSGISVLFTAASDITINGIVTLGTGTTFNGGSYSTSVGGNWVNSGTFNGNTGTLTFTGNAAAVSGSGVQNFNNLTVAGSLVTFSNGSISLTGSLATTGAGTFIQAPGGTLLMTGSGVTIGGSAISLENLTISGTVSTAAYFNITGNFAVSGSFTASSGTITMNGVSKIISGTGTKIFSVFSAAGVITTGVDFTITSALVVNGSLAASAGTATFTGSSTLSGSANLFNATLNGTSLQLTSNSKLGIANLLTITAGTLNVTTSTPNTVNFNASSAQNINAITFNNLILSKGNSKTAVGGITVNNSITIDTGTTFIPGAFTHSIYVDWNNNGTFTAGTSTIQFLGTVNSNIRGATNFNILTVNNSTTTTPLLLQSNVSASTVNMTSGMMLTGTNTLTITSTRTGDGTILGNIQRTHAFTTGVAYAFESPNNTIAFTAVSSVTSVTVSVMKGSVSDFPFGGSISRLYTIAVPAGSYTATLRLHYEHDELNGNVESDLALWYYNGSTWGSIGKTAIDTVPNYVEQTGLTNITNRWTLSSNSNVVQWTGGVSTDWNTPGNWTVLQGSATGPPSATDIVNLGTIAFTYPPTINSAVSVKNINFGSVQALALSMAPGGSLTSGDIHGTWSSAITHTINANDQSITINGDLTLSDSTSGHAINLNIGTGMVTVSGSVSQSGGANIVFTGAGNLNIGANHHYTSGTFTPGTGTVTYNGATGQLVAPVGYNNLTINKSAASASINNNTTIGGNLLLTAGELHNSAITTITGNVTISSGVILQNTNILHVGGNWANSGTFNGSGIAVIFDGSGTQTISPTTFNNLILNKPVGSLAMLTGNILINGDFTVISGTFDIKTFSCDRLTQGGTLTLDSLATFIVGANNSPLNFSFGDIADSSTVIADGIDVQYIFNGIAFGNLILRNAGPKVLVSSFGVNGNLVIESGAILDGGGQTLNLQGNWINNGTFSASGSTIIFSGAAKTISGVNTFYNAIYTGSYTALNNYTNNSSETIALSGSLAAGSGITLTYNGDIISRGTLTNNGTATFTGLVAQTITSISATVFVATLNFNGSVSPIFNTTATPFFGVMNINNTGGVSPTEGWTIFNSLSVGTGAKFYAGISTHNLQGHLTNNGTITSSGILNFIPTSAATINFGTNFKSTGRVVFGGAGAITMAGTPDTMNIVVVSNTNAAGISPSSNWIITNSFTINSPAIFNAGSHTYTLGGNLSNRGALYRGTSTFILNGSAGQDISTPSAFNNLTINNTFDSVTLSSTILVYGVLNFIKGKIRTGTNTASLQLSGSVTGAGQSTGWVNGNLQKIVAVGSNIARTFEVGDSLYYTPVTTLFANVTTQGSLTAKSTAKDHPNLETAEMDVNKTVNRYFTLTNAGTVFTTADVTFNWAAADVDAGANTAFFHIKKFNGSIWSLVTNVSPLPTSIMATGITVFSDFAIGYIALASWTGAANTNWFNAENWSAGVPASVTDVFISRGLTNYPVLTTGTAVAQNLTIDTGASVIVNGAALQIAGIIRNGGLFTASNGTINMSSSFSQAIPINTFTGNTIKNLTVNNSAGVTLEDTLSLTGVLKVTNGQLNTGGRLTLVSTATQTALIDGSGTGDVLGNVTMQRYLPSGFGYRYISSPFQAATVKELSDDLNLGAAFPLFYRYDENQLSSGWVKYTDTLGVLHPGEGYSANLGNSTAAKTLTLKGVVNNNTISTATIFNHNNAYTLGFNLVGNPYPSPINWNAASGWSRTNIDNAVYYFNAGATDQYAGTYSTYINGVSSDGVASNVIAAMQGFFVHVTNGTYPVAASLTLNNNARSNNLSPVFHRQMSITAPLVRISAGFADERTVADHVVAYFEDAATRAFDKEMDALKLLNTDPLVPNVYMIASDAAKLSIGGWPAMTDSTDRIPLGLQIKQAGWITLKATDIERIPAGRHIYLYDAKTGLNQDVQVNPRYRIYLETGVYENRFFLVFIQQKDSVSLLSVNNGVFNVYGMGGKVFVNLIDVPGEKCVVTITNLTGQVLMRKQLNGNGVHDLGTKLISGTYVITLYTPQTMYSKKILIGN